MGRKDLKACLDHIALASATLCMRKPRPEAITFDVCSVRRACALLQITVRLDVKKTRKSLHVIVSTAVGLKEALKNHLASKAGSGCHKISLHRSRIESPNDIS
jgi:hypothetical protein